MLTSGSKIMMLGCCWDDIGIDTNSAPDGMQNHG